MPFINKDNEYVIYKLNGNGDFLWTKNYGNSHDVTFPNSNGNEWLRSMIEMRNGVILLAGESETSSNEFNSKGDKQEEGNGLRDYWVIRIDTQGNKIWNQIYGGTSSDYLKEMVMTSDGYLALVGESESGIGPEKSTPPSSWVLKVDLNNGNILWDMTILLYITKLK